MTERDELTDGVVVRLPARTFDDTEFTAEHDAADSGDFLLNSQEFERVENGDGIGALSVWDRNRTTVEQACAMLPPKPRLILEMDVAGVSNAEPDMPYEPLHVFRTPIAGESPGADGHCDIEDVWQSKAQNKKIRAALAALAGIAVGRHVPS